MIQARWTIPATSANGGNLTLEGAITGSGTAEITGTATLDFGAVSSAAVGFDAGTAGTLKLEHSSSFAGTVAGLAAGDSIDLADLGFGATTTVAYDANAAGTGKPLTVSNAAQTASLALLGQYAAAGFQTAADPGTGTIVTYDPNLVPPPPLGATRVWHLAATQRRIR